MPRVVLLATDPDLTVESITEQLGTWSGAPLDVVLVSLHPVPGTVTDAGRLTWADGTALDAADRGLVGRSYEERPASQPPASALPAAGQRGRARADLLRTTPARLRSAVRHRLGRSGPTRRSAGPSSRALRLRAEAAARARGVSLWAHVSSDEEVCRLVSGGDAVAAVDQGAVRAAFQLARRNHHLVATNGLVPCLVELEARSQTSDASRTSSAASAE